MTDASSNWSFPAIVVGNSSSASIRPTFAALIRSQRGTSSSLWPDAAVEVGAKPVAAISSPPAPTKGRYKIERSTPFGEKGIAALGTLP